MLRPFCSLGMENLYSSKAAAMPGSGITDFNMAMVQQ